MKEEYQAERRRYLDSVRIEDGKKHMTFRNLVFLAAATAASTLSAAETVTLPVAASVVGAGGVPFVSDVRVFNTSYTEVLTVTAVYRFNGSSQVFQLGPREAKAFDDIGVSLFGAPNSLG